MYFDDEEGNKYYEAYFDGYDIGERLLEGVMFKVSIIDNELKVSYSKEDESYMSQLNKKMWLESALEYAKENDIFNEKPTGTGGKELVLKNEDGSVYYEGE